MDRRGSYNGGHRLGARSGTPVVLAKLRPSLAVSGLYGRSGDAAAVVPGRQHYHCEISVLELVPVTLMGRHFVADGLTARSCLLGPFAAGSEARACIRNDAKSDQD